MSAISLNTLHPGDSGIIESVQSPSLSVRQRLLEMGMTKGTKVEIIRYAPMGDPIEISIRGYRLSLRREEAEAVLLQTPTDAGNP